MSYGILITILNIFYTINGLCKETRIFHARKHVIFETAGLGHREGRVDDVTHGDKETKGCRINGLVGRYGR